MEEKFIIELRYEYMSVNGKTFTKWFPINTGEQYTEKEGKEYLKKYKKDFEYIDKKTKMKHEYRLKKYSEYKQEYEENINQIKKLNKKQEEYYKSDQYKELCKKKRQSKKELKEKQQKYKELYENRDI